MQQNGRASPESERRLGWSQGGVEGGWGEVGEEGRAGLTSAMLPRDSGNVTRLAAITFSIFPNCVCANETPAGPSGVISNTARPSSLGTKGAVSGRHSGGGGRAADVTQRVTG